MTALVIYVGLFIILAVLDPETNLQGIPVKIIIILCLVKGIQAAIAYQKERDEEARAQAEADQAGPNYE